jgi:hypothetical protein
MNKADLKQAYGHYCDTDKLVDDIMRLLTKYYHNNTEEGVCAMLNKFFENKKDLIDLFIQSKNYIGDLRISFDIELVRETSRSELSCFCDAFSEKVRAKDVICKYKDEHGKTLNDYLAIGIKSLTARDLMNDNIRKQLTVNDEHKNAFVASDGRTRESDKAFQTFSNMMYAFGRYCKSALDDDMVSKLEQYEINERFASNLKTSRAFNRVCAHFGVDKLPKYNKLFAQYSDMISDTKRKMIFYMSLNPLDYLTMSFGKSWASCHTIDKTNKRRMPNSYSGAYCGGTLSYMLDQSSFVTFVHSHVPEDIIEEGKIYRNMFHYQNDMLVQGRIYPQGTDGNTDLYKVFRGFVQKEMAALLGITNAWVKSGTRPSSVTYSRGAHYRDYECFGNCNVSHHKEKGISENYVNIGHEGICPNCGAPVTYDSRLTCHNC